MKNESCSDPECPGCLASEFVSKMIEQGADIELILSIIAAACEAHFNADITVHEVGKEVVH